MRLRTAAILSLALVLVTGVMFAIQSVLMTTFIPPLSSDLPISGFDRHLIVVALFCSHYKWLVAIFTFAAVPALITIAVFTSDSRTDKTPGPTPPPGGRLPALWNPKAAAVWSLVFTQAFGAFLHARNAEAMGRLEEAKANRTWFYVSMAYLGLTLVTIPFPAVPGGLFSLAAFGLLIGWYWNVGRKQVVYVRQTWREGYLRKPWKKPLLIAFCCLMGTFIVLTIAEKLVFGSQ